MVDGAETIHFELAERLDGVALELVDGRQTLVLGADYEVPMDCHALIPIALALASVELSDVAGFEFMLSVLGGIPVETDLRALVGIGSVGIWISVLFCLYLSGLG